MITVIWYDGGLCEAVVSSPKSLHALLHMLEKSKSQFKVYVSGGYVAHHHFGWGEFYYWLEKDESFRST